MFSVGGQGIPTRRVLLIASDCVLIGLSVLFAAAVRFAGTHYLWAHIRTSVTPARFGVLLLVCLVSLYYYDLYDFQVVTRRSTLLVNLLNALGVTSLCLGIFYYVAPELSLGRGIAVLAAPVMVLLLLGWRLLLEATPSLRRTENLLVLGTGTSGISLVREILKRPELNFKVVGFLDEAGKNIGKSLVNPGIIGGLAEVETLVRQHQIDRVVISLAERRGTMPVQSLLRLKFMGVAVEDAHTFHERLSGQIMLSELNPSWLILGGGFRKPPLYMVTKRMGDIALSLLALLLVWPVMALVALAIWLESRGPILYRQMRVGLNGRQFEILKFRSMINSCDQQKPSWTADGDRRITRVGRLIREYRLDELPQFINVLLGEMSLVGPRPEQPYFCSLLEEKIPFYTQRHSVRPGITGWAQIKYRYGASVEDARSKLEYDLFYIKHLSFPLDLAILLETGKVLLSGRGAK